MRPKIAVAVRDLRSGLFRKKSKAGRLGTAILFLGLGLCLFAFLAKPIITYVIEMARGISG